MTTNFSKAIELMSEALYTKKFDNGIKRVILRDGSPEWMIDAIYEAREAMGDQGFPRDDVYKAIRDVIVHLAENEAEDVESAYDLVNEYNSVNGVEPDTYTSDLLEWLSGNVGNVDYLGQAVTEFGSTDGYQILANAQRLFIGEYGRAIIDAISEQVENSALLEDIF